MFGWGGEKRQKTVLEQRLKQNKTKKHIETLKRRECEEERDVPTAKECQGLLGSH